MQCPSCRKEIPDDSNNCIYCGAQISSQTRSRTYSNSTLSQGAYEETNQYAKSEAVQRYERQVNALYQDRNTVRTPQPPQEGRGFAKASLVLGIIGTALFLTSWFAFILGGTGIVFSVVSYNKGCSGGVRTAGLVLSIIATILGAIIGIINL